MNEWYTVLKKGVPLKTANKSNLDIKEKDLWVMNYTYVKLNGFVNLTL